MIEKITNHIQKLKELNLSQYRNKPNFDLILESFGEQVQELENVLYALLETTLQNATGKRLDLEGEMLGKTRPKLGLGSIDDKYRLLILSKIAQNHSYSTWTDIYNILGLLGVQNIKSKNIHSQTIEIDYPKIDLLNVDEIKEIIESSTGPIGVNISSNDTLKPFGFNGNPNAFGFGEGILSRLAKNGN